MSLKASNQSTILKTIVPIFCVFMLVVTSCKKDFTCDCDDDLFDVKYESLKKKDAEVECNLIDETLPTKCELVEE